MGRVLHWLNRGLSRVEEVFAAVGLLLTSVIVFVNVVLRYGFRSGVPWSDELVRYLMIWVTFVGAAICVREGLHVGIEILINRLEGVAKKVALTIVAAIGLAFSYSFARLGLEAVRFLKMTGQVSPAMELPMWIVYIILPLGGCLMALRYLQTLIAVWRPSFLPSTPSIDQSTEGGSVVG